MFVSYVSEASPGYRYVLGARARMSVAVGAVGATDAGGANGATTPYLLHILSIITHPVQ